MLAQAPACVEQLREWKAGRRYWIKTPSRDPGTFPTREAGSGLVEYVCLMARVVPTNPLDPAQAVGHRGLGG